MEILKLIAAVLIALALGSGIGYYMAPDKIKIQEKIIEKEVTKKEEYKKETKKYDKDGKVTEDSVETGTKQTNTDITKTDKTMEKEKTRKQWAAKLGVAANPRDLGGKLTPRVGLESALPFFNSSVGIEADVNMNNPLVGLYLRVEF